VCILTFGQPTFSLSAGSSARETAAKDIVSVLTAAEAGMAEEAVVLSEIQEGVDAVRRSMAQSLRAALVE
jgi:hypothetical protein